MKPVVIVAIAFAVAVVGAPARTAHAYPQFQLARDQTCTNCHVSPAGGGILNENGLNVAEGISQWGGTPEVLHGALGPPSWLLLGGDVRGLAGYFVTPYRKPAAFPMQAELYANAIFGGGFSAHVTAGVRSPRDGSIATTFLWSREHYVMWQQNPDEPNGLYVRAGHFMPVFGLRFAEHPDYTRRFGGTALDTEPYGVAAEWIQSGYEIHATGFARDRLIEAASVDSGAALYAEARPTTELALGGEAMATVSKDDAKQRLGATGKVLLPTDVLVEAELIGTRQSVPLSAGGSEIVHQLTGYLLGSKFVTDWLLLDIGLGYFNENLRYRGLDRECLDVNLHWFSTSHLEAVLNTRLEMIGFHQPVDGQTSPIGAYAAIQLHYRL